MASKDNTDLALCKETIRGLISYAEYLLIGQKIFAARSVRTWNPGRFSLKWK